jgi:predicted MFS family arabinose efflux permease
MTYMGDAFPEVSTVALQSIISIHAFPAAILALIAGYLTNKFRLKTLGITGMTCFLIGGTGIAMMNNFNAILALRLLWGIGMGFTYSVVTATIIRYLNDEQRVKAMGYRQVAMQGAQIAMSLGSGYLAMISWRAPFLVYSVNAVIIALIAFFLPRKKDDIPPSSDAGGGLGLKCPPFIYAYCLLTWLTQAGIYVFQTNMPMLIIGNGIGTSVQVGRTGACVALGGVIAGLFFKKVGAYFGRFTIAVSLFVYTCTHLVCAMVTPEWSIYAMYVNALIHGFAYFIFNGTSLLNPGIAVKPAERGAAIGLANAVHLLGMFLTPYIFVPLATSIWNRNLPQDRFLLSVFWLGLCTIVFVILGLKKARVMYSIPKEDAEARFAKKTADGQA